MRVLPKEWSKFWFNKLHATSIRIHRTKLLHPPSDEHGHNLQSLMLFTIKFGSLLQNSTIPRIQNLKSILILFRISSSATREKDLRNDHQPIYYEWDLLFNISIAFSNFGPRYYMRIFHLQSLAVSLKTFAPTRPMNGNLNEGEVARHVSCIYDGPPQANVFEAEVEVRPSMS